MNVKHKKKADVICWSTVEFNLIEAVNELEDLLARVSDQVRIARGTVGEKWCKVAANAVF